MRKLILPVLLAVSILISCNDASRKTSAGNEMLAKASLSEKNGWKMIHLEGKPEVIGYQHGYLLAQDILGVRGAMSVLNRQAAHPEYEFEKEYLIDMPGQVWTLFSTAVK